MSCHGTPKLALLETEQGYPIPQHIGFSLIIYQTITVLSTNVRAFILAPAAWSRIVQSSAPTLFFSSVFTRVSRS